MFKIIILLIIALGAGFLSAHIYPNLGEVNVLIAHTKIALPIGLAIGIMIGVFIIYNLILRLIFGVYFVAKKFVNVIIGKDHHIAGLIYSKAMYEYYVGNYAAAKHLFIKGSGGAEEPLINYLQAAKCAHLLKKYTVRDKLFMSCYAKFVDNLSLINFNYAQLCKDEGDYEKGLSLLLSVEPEKVNEDEYFKLKTDLLYSSSNFHKLAELLPEVNKNRSLDEQDLMRIQVATYEYILQQLPSEIELHHAWNEIPRKLRSLPQLIIPYVKLINNFNRDEAEIILRKAIDHEYNSQLVELYGNIESANLSKQISIAESWCKNHENDYALNLCLGKLCTSYKLWGKAKDYLEKSINLNSSQESFIQYIKLCSLMGDNVGKLEVIERYLNTR